MVLIGRPLITALWRRAGLRPWLLVLAAFALLLVLGALQQLPNAELVVGGSLQPPRLGFATCLGTDLLGRSVLFRLLAGAQTASTVGCITVVLAVPVGVLLGLWAAWFGGKVDAVITALYTVFASVPDILLITAIAFAMGKGMTTMCVAIAATSWIGVMRLVRAEVLKIRALDYTTAARALGSPPWRILWRQVLPNVWHVVIASSTVTLVMAIKAEVVLTFLGLGIQEGTSWGLMISAAAQDLPNHVWWPLLSVVVAMFLLIYSLSLTGDALRDALDPRMLRGS